MLCALNKTARMIQGGATAISFLHLLFRPSLSWATAYRFS